MRRVLGLLRHLPPESAFVTSLSHGWSDAQELRAAQVEVTHALYRATLAAHGSKRVPRQIRVPRPHLRAVEPRVASDDETIAFFTGGHRG